MNNLKPAEVIEILWSTYDPLLSVAHPTSTLSGHCPVRLKADTLILPPARKMYGLLGSFGGSAYRMFDPEDGATLLFPDKLLKERCSGFNNELLRKTLEPSIEIVDRDVVIPGIRDFFGDEKDLSVAGCGLYLEVLPTKALLEQLEEAEPVLDALLGSYDGVPFN